MSQIIEPYMFGDPWRKRTALWLRGLPPLIMTEAAEIPTGCWVECKSLRKDPTYRARYPVRGKRSAKERSKTFPGIARAMAEQWAGDARGDKQDGVGSV